MTDVAQADTTAIVLSAVGAIVTFIVLGFRLQTQITAQINASSDKMLTRLDAHSQQSSERHAELHKKIDAEIDGVKKWADDRFVNKEVHAASCRNAEDFERLITAMTERPERTI